MRNTGRLAFLLLTAVLAGACSSGNVPTPPTIVQAGWSWNPAVAGDRPLPVVWVNGGSPVQLSLLAGGDCGASGSVQAVANLGGAPLLAGISVACAGGVSTMSPVTWLGGTVTALELPRNCTDVSPFLPCVQGTALAVATVDGDTFVAGASGIDYPLPTIWKNGTLGTTNPFNMLPPGYDSGIITSLAVTSKYAIAAGIVHAADSDPPFYAGAVWVLDPDFSSGTAGFLDPPASLLDSTFEGGVATTFDGLQVYSVAAVSQDGQEKPVFWLDDVPYPISGSSFSSGPYAVPTGIALVDQIPYVTGFFRSSGPFTAPQPVIWTPSATQVLPGLGAIGSGEAVAIHTVWAFVSGESLGTDPTDATRSISVPAIWVNGDRTDLPALVGPGGGPTLGGALHGWWKVRMPAGTPDLDWPFPGGFSQVLDAATVAAAGSAVARALVTIP